MNPVAITLRLAGEGGAELFPVTNEMTAFRFSADQNYRFVTEEGITTRFAPWLSLDDVAELATALRKAGRIEAWYSGWQPESGFYAGVHVEGWPHSAPITMSSPGLSESHVLFFALARALGVEGA